MDPELPSAAARLTPDAAAAASPQGLADRRSLALIAVERTMMPMVVCDPRQPDNPIVLANKAFLDMTGYTAAEVIGRNCRFLQGPETDPVALDQIRAAIRARRECFVDIVNYRKDGESFVNELHISPVHDDDGQLLYFFASQLDVTLRRRAADLLAAEHSLLREVDHRAKNALALVQGIVRLSNASDAAGYAAAVQGRVDALSVAHGLLADGHWRTVPLDRLIRNVVEQQGLRRISIDGPPMEIDAGQVQPLALVFHEIASNAARFGALSVERGQLAISWRQDPDRVVVTLAESGGPPPAQQRKAGFGLTMIEAIVRRQLRGEVDLDWVPGGLSARIHIPPTVARHGPQA